MILSEKIHILHSKIQDKKSGWFNSVSSDEIIELLNDLCKTKEDTINLIDEYEINFSKDLIEEIKKLGSSYNAIERNLSVFIQLGIVEEKYPHKKLIDNSEKIKQKKVLINNDVSNKKKQKDNSDVKTIKQSHSKRDSPKAPNKTNKNVKTLCCGKCGTQNSKTNKYCSVCGNKLNELLQEKNEKNLKIGCLIFSIIIVIAIIIAFGSLDDGKQTEQENSGVEEVNLNSGSLEEQIEKNAKNCAIIQERNSNPSIKTINAFKNALKVINNAYPEYSPQQISDKATYTWVYATKHGYDGSFWEYLSGFAIGAYDYDLKSDPRYKNKSLEEALVLFTALCIEAI